MKLKAHLYKCQICRDILFHIADTRRIGYEKELAPRKWGGVHAKTLKISI